MNIIVFDIILLCCAFLIWYTVLVYQEEKQFQEIMMETKE